MRNDGYDEEFDYTGKDLVAMDRRAYRVVPGTLGRHWEGGDPLGACGLAQAADGVLGNLEARAGASSGTLRALKVWHKMGDRRVRVHVKGLYLRQGRVLRELVAYTDTPGWAQEFQMLAGPYRQEWNHLCEVEGLPMRADKLTFKVSSRTGSSAEAAASASARPAPATSPVPLSAEERAEVERAVSVIGDDALRRKAYSAMKSVLEWQKSNKTK